MFLLPNPNNLNSVVDTIKASDTCLFVLSHENGMDKYGDYLFELIYSYHLPTAMFTVQGLREMPVKSQCAARDNLQSILDKK